MHTDIPVPFLWPAVLACTYTSMLLEKGQRPGSHLLILQEGKNWKDAELGKLKEIVTELKPESTSLDCARAIHDLGRLLAHAQPENWGTILICFNRESTTGYCELQLNKKQPSDPPTYLYGQLIWKPETSIDQAILSTRLLQRNEDIHIRWLQSEANFPREQVLLWNALVKAKLTD